MRFFKKNVSASDLWVRSSERLSDFYTSSWQPGESAVPVLLVRGCLLAAAAGVLVWSLFLNMAGGPSAYWLIYLTNWGQMLNTAFFLSGFIVSCRAATSKLPEYEVTPWYISVYWLLFNVGTGIAILITVLYWTLVFKPEDERELQVFWLDVSTHGFNSCLVIIELLTCRTPVRALHVYQPLAIGLGYLAFTGIYYAAGGLASTGEPFIYPVLDWRNAGQIAVIVVVAVFILLVTYAVVYLLAFIRDTLSKKYIRNTGHDLPQAPIDTTKIV